MNRYIYRINIYQDIRIIKKEVKKHKKNKTLEQKQDMIYVQKQEKTQIALKLELAKIR